MEKERLPDGFSAVEEPQNAEPDPPVKTEAVPATATKPAEPAVATPTTPEDVAMPMPVKQAHTKRNLIAASIIFLVFVIGSGAGWFFGTNDILAKKATATMATVSQKIDTTAGVTESAVNPSLSPQDIRDTAKGTVKVKPSSEMQKQGSHILQRDDAPWPIYLTSSTIDLSQYEGKHVKIYGVTFDGGTNDWYMEVNKVDLL